MCGLVGVFGNIAAKPKQSLDCFHGLLIINQLRGSHSTGVAKIRMSKSKPLIHKTLGDPMCLLTEKSYQDLIQDKLTDIVGVMGHGRYATKGSISVENAHPFRHGHITVTHNGTVWDTGVKDAKFETDSETITYSLAKKGVDETWQSIRGAAALVWWNAAEQSLNMVTNGERPLCYARTEDERIFWASESWMLSGILTGREDKVKLIGNTVMALKPNYLFIWTFRDKKLHKEVRQLPEVKPYSTNWTKPWNGVSNVVKGMFGKTEKKKTEKFVIQEVDKVKEALTTWGLRRPAQAMNFLEWQQTQKECACCTEILGQRDWHQGLVDKENRMICKVCVDLFLDIGWGFYFEQQGKVGYA